MKDVNGVEKGVREMGLLIQLFGREVIERLGQAGFDSSETIVQAGPERLAEAGGIPAPLARRIVAVAAEACEPERCESEAGAPEAPALAGGGPAGTGPAPAPEASPAGGRSPRRGPRSRAVTDRPVGAKALVITAPPPGRAARAEKKRPGGRSRAGRHASREADPFVDDVGLVAWMGLASQPGSRSTLSFPVADAILDPAPPAVERAAPEPVGPVAGATAGATVGVAPAAVPVAAPGASPDPGRPPRSLWSFGVMPAKTSEKPRPSQPVSEKRAGLGDHPSPDDPSPDGPAHASPRPIFRRRVHDGH